jgi:hypothetical protein
MQELTLMTSRKMNIINNVNIKVIRDAFEYVGEYFLDIINESLLTAQFPKTWKTATVITKKCDVQTN